MYQVVYGSDWKQLTILAKLSKWDGSMDSGCNCELLQTDSLHKNEVYH